MCVEYKNVHFIVFVRGGFLFKHIVVCDEAIYVDIKCLFDNII